MNIINETEFELYFKQLQNNNGSQLPTFVEFIEAISPRFENKIMLFAQALKHPHYRVRIAVLRSLFNMGELFEFIEQDLLQVANDKCESVLNTLGVLLNHNFSLLSDNLKKATQDIKTTQLTKNQEKLVEQLDQSLWKSRICALNGVGEDNENVIFELRKLTETEKELSYESLLQKLFLSHHLPFVKNSFQQIDRKQMDSVLHYLLKPIHDMPEFIKSNGLVINCSLEMINKQLLSFFKSDYTIYSNHFIDKHGTRIYNPVSYGLIDGGLLCINHEFLFFYWVSDED